MKDKESEMIEEEEEIQPIEKIDINFNLEEDTVLKRLLEKESSESEFDEANDSFVRYQKDKIHCS